MLEQCLVEAGALAANAARLTNTASNLNQS
jgi:hypothetical protein